MKTYSYSVTQYGETLAVFDTYRDAAKYLRGIQPDDERWEHLQYAIEEHRENIDDEQDFALSKDGE